MKNKRTMRKIIAALTSAVIGVSVLASYVSAAEIPEPAKPQFIKNIMSSSFMMKMTGTVKPGEKIDAVLKSDDINNIAENKIAVLDLTRESSNDNGFCVSMPVLKFGSGDGQIEKLIIQNCNANVIVSSNISSLSDGYTFFTIDFEKVSDITKPYNMSGESAYRIKFYAGDIDNLKAQEIKYLENTVSIFIPMENSDKDSAKTAVSAYENKNNDIGAAFPIANSRYEDGGISFPALMNGFYSPVYNDVNFKDTSKDSYAYDYINFLSYKGIVNGKDADIYAPGDALTRADSILMLIRALHIMPRDIAYDYNKYDKLPDASGETSESPGDKEFEDTKGKYYSELVAFAKKLGIAQGFDNYFNPEVSITRQDIMCLIARSVDSKYPDALPMVDVSVLDKYIDYAEIDAYAKQSAARLVSAGVINGYPDLSIGPKKNITREEIAAVIARLLESFSSSMDEVSKGAGYNYSYPGPGLNTNLGTPTKGFKGDNNSAKLTDGKLAAKNATWPNITLDDIRYNRGGSASNESVYLDMQPNFYITEDLGFVAKVKRAEMTFRVADSYTLPAKVMMYYGNDGTNNNFYLGEAELENYNGYTARYVINLPFAVSAKTIKIVAESDIGAKIAFDEFRVYGNKQNTLKVLSNGCTYTTDGRQSSENPDNNYLLTDSKFALLQKISDKAFVSYSPTKKQYGGSYYGAYYENVQEIIIDLNSVKNISDIKLSSLFDANAAFNISRMHTYISTDNKNYTEFGVSSKISASGPDRNLYRAFYKVTHNSTQKARYVKIKLVTDTKIYIDEITVSGSENEIAEPEYEFFENGDYEDYTNVAIGSKAYDLYFPTSKIDNACNGIVDTSASSLRKESGTMSTGVVIDLGREYDEVCQVMYQINKSAANDIKFNKIYAAGEDGEYKYIGDTDEMFTYETNTAFRLNFDKVKARYIKIISQHSALGNVNIREIEVYNGKAHLPILTGGFHNYFLDLGPNFTAHHYDDAYNSFLYLKGLKEMGMKMVVFSGTGLEIQKDPNNNLDIIRRLTMYSGLPDTLVQKGYVKGGGHPSDDVVESYLAAADKVNIDVLLATMAGNPPIQNAPGSNTQQKLDYLNNYIDSFIGDAKEIIKFIDNKYKHHKSLAGFYFTDETCDYWLDLYGGKGTDVYQKIYKQQSDYVHTLNEDYLTMICPAIWRSSTPQKFYENMKKLIQNPNGNKRPYVDIVAFQDCLGREASIVVDENIYPVYEALLEAGMQGVRDAGGMGWNDIEVFDARYYNKRYTEVKKCIDIETKHTRGNIVFDLPTYFTPPVSMNISEPIMFSKDYNSRTYVTDIRERYGKYLNEDL